MSSSIIDAGVQCAQLEPEHHPGTLVVLQWSQWLAENNLLRSPAEQIRTFQKEGRELRLVVYQYSNALCCVIARYRNSPRMRDFRPWKDSLESITQKLGQAGWTYVGEAGEEAGHDIQ